MVFAHEFAKEVRKKGLQSANGIIIERLTGGQFCFLVFVNRSDFPEKCFFVSNEALENAVEYSGSKSERTRQQEKGAHFNIGERSLVNGESATWTLRQSCDRLLRAGQEHLPEDDA